MKAIAELELVPEDVEVEELTGGVGYRKDSIIRIEEGLIGFSQCKEFILMEKPEIAPFRMLKSVDAPDIAFVVLDPNILVPKYYDNVPAREWESIGVIDSANRLAFAIAIIGPTPRQSSANLQAPLLMNYREMIARQVILTDAGFSFRHPLAG